MGKVELKTKLNDASVEKFLKSVTDEQRRADAFEVLELFKKITKEPAKMWGASIVGFGTYRYRYASGQEGDWMLGGFSPRKQALTLYIMSGFDAYDDLLKDLGKFKTGKSCLYVKNLDDIDRRVLTKLIRESIKYMKNTDHIAKRVEDDKKRKGTKKNPAKKKAAKKAAKKTTKKAVKKTAKKKVAKSKR